jgi:hypothetical protein
MQRNALFIMAVLGALLPAPAFAADGGHSSVFGEVPLMPGMTEAPVETLPGMPPMTAGTITGNRQMVVSFYNQALRDEGWEPLDASLKKWRRDGETLSFSIVEKDGKSTVTFMIEGRP